MGEWGATPGELCPSNPAWTPSAEQVTPAVGLGLCPSFGDLGLVIAIKTWYNGIVIKEGVRNGKFD